MIIIKHLKKLANQDQEHNNQINQYPQKSLISCLATGWVVGVVKSVETEKESVAKSKHC